MYATGEHRRKALKMLQDPESWPMWPILPMKHDEHGAGFCVSADYPTIVMKKFLTSKGIILQLSCEVGVPLPGRSNETFHAGDEAKAIYESHIQKRYEDLDGMLDDGWRID